jgi:hypothetical protein
MSSWLMGLVLGVCAAVAIHVDDPPRYQPPEDRRRVAVADEDNGLVVLEEMLDRFGIHADTDIETLRLPGPDDPERGTPAYYQIARDVLARESDFMAMGERILDRPALILPAREHVPFDEAREDRMAVLGYLSGLWDIQAQLHLADEKDLDALRMADNHLRLARALFRGTDSFSMWGAASQELRSGISLAATVARSGAAAPAVLIDHIDLLPPDDELKAAAVSCLTVELAAWRKAVLRRTTVAGVRDFLTDRTDNDSGDASLLAREERLVRGRFPWVKPNMTLNAAAFGLYVGMLDGYPGAAIVRRGPAWLDFSLAQKISQAVRNPGGNVFLFLDMMSLDYDSGSVVQGYFRTLAKSRQHRIFLALRCYQLEHGRLPATLGELAPGYLAEVPADPFSGGPFVYEPDATPPRLVCVGEDRELDVPGKGSRDDRIIELDFAAPAPDASR